MEIKIPHPAVLQDWTVSSFKALLRLGALALIAITLIGTLLSFIPGFNIIVQSSDLGMKLLGLSAVVYALQPKNQG